MASFYNNYYRYYRPYASPISNHYPIPDKSSFKSDSPLESQKNMSIRDVSELTPESSNRSSHKEEKSSRFYSFGPIHFKNLLFDDIEEPIFEILGIQLYLDDIIILGLLFFLYQEGVQDEMLFIALILLLLS